MRRIIVFSVMLAAAIIMKEPASGQAPATMSYQGLLTTAGGTPVPTGLYKLQFDLFTDSTGGSSFWTEVDSGISVQRGSFSVVLGAVSALPDSFHRPLYLQVTGISGPGIGSPETFNPRSPLTSAPYAMGLRAPITAASNAPVLGGINTGYGTGILGNSYTPFSTLGGVTGQGFANEGNGVFGMEFNGNAAWAVGGWSDSGVGVAGTVSNQNGIGIAGYNTPNGLAVYSYGRLRVDATGDDSAVILPPNSISSYEILDEPGISQGIAKLAGVVVGINPLSLTDIDSTTITTPSAGYVVVEASAQAALSSGTSNFDVCQIDDVPRNSSDGNYNYNVGFTNGPTGVVYLPTTMRRTFYVSAGTYTYYFESYNSGGGSYMWNPVITASYFPTAYGTVSSIVPPSVASSYEKSDAVETSVPAPQGTVTRRSGSIVDLRELQLKATKLREEAERAENELLKARLEKLKALDKTGSIPNNNP